MATIVDVLLKRDDVAACVSAQEKHKSGNSKLAQGPKVSIGLPVYNGENYLAETLDCLVNQTFRDFEIVILDNASTDKTPEICQAYASRDARIRYHRNETNIGAVQNYNKAFALSEAPYFKWTAHDDLYAPTYLEECVAVLDRSPDVVLAHCATQMIGPTGTPLSFDPATETYVDHEFDMVMPVEPTELAEMPAPEDRMRDILLRMYWCTSVFGVIRRDVLARTSLHDDYYGSDKVLLVQLALMGRFHHVRDHLFSKRCHPEMSAFKGTDDKADWINPENRQAFAPLYLLRDYASAAFKYGDLTAIQRAKCLCSVAAKITRAGLWGRLFINSPHNPLLFGFLKRRRVSTAD